MTPVLTWLFEGGKDTSITAERLPRMEGAIKAANVPYRYTIYPEAGHAQTWEQAYADPKLYEWMLAQKREH
jgi:dienelactone hydrolase